MTLGVERNYKSKELPNQSKFLCKRFESILHSYGSTSLEPVKISSGIDSSVRLIGSHISVMKPFFMDGKIPKKGLYMIQPCIRTRNLDSMFDESVEHKWGSYFTSLGLIVEKEDIGLLFQCLNELLDEAKVGIDKLLLRASSKDCDLINLASEYMPAKMELDTQTDSYYRHKLGIDGVRGRNFNLAIQDESNGVFSDVGNVICIENSKGEKLCYELALGASTILKQVSSLAHVLDVHDLPSVPQFKGSNELRKLQDCIISARVLLGEGLRPFGDDNRSRLLKTFLQGILYFKLKYSVYDAQLKSIIEKFETDELPDQESLVYYILDFISSYSATLTSKQNISKTESLILDLM